MSQTSRGLFKYVRVARYLRAKVLNDTSGDLVECEMIARDLRAKFFALPLRRGACKLRRLFRRAAVVAMNLACRSMSAVVRERRRRATVRALLRLDDRILQDIGIRRDHIHVIAEELATRSGTWPRHRRAAPQGTMLERADASSATTLKDEMKPAA